LQPREKLFIGFFSIANLITLGGLLFALASGWFALHGNMKMCMVLLGYSGVCDLFDGFVARKIKRDRPEIEKSFGIQLDSLVDVVNFGVVPAVIVFAFTSIFAGNAWYVLAVCAFYIICAVIRLAYFNATTTGEVTKHYRGLPVTSIALILPFMTYFFNAFSLPVYTWLIVLGVTGVFFVLNVKIPKPRGIWYIIFPAVAVVFTVLWHLQ
jgi:CDP-diacylglycerol--serine O-phosphatidyltransferase